MNAQTQTRAANPADLCGPGYWRAICPGLHVGTLPQQGPTTPRQTLERLSQRMEKEGYFSDHDEALIVLAPKLAAATQRIVDLGLPSVFLWMYDETWACFQRVRPVLAHLLGDDFRVLPNFWAWHVDPTKGQTGWRPHRDLGSKSLAPDGSPLSLTCWIPITEATPMNSCMYIVPADLDPHYRDPDSVKHNDAEGHAVRALPAKPGEYFIWNQAVLHWGSRSSPFAESPRISAALEFQRGDAPPFATPFVEGEMFPQFGQRLRLVARQILHYQHLYGTFPKLLEFAQFLLTANVRAD